MEASQPCDLCGCKEVNLHDGFYFCAECGTQDTNFQETIIENVEVDGGILHGRKRKIANIVEEEKEMSDAWYKWHGFNFLLKGTADELLVHGANPSFKKKLLWVWTRYIKKYLKNEEMGLNENPHNTSGNAGQDDKEVDSDVDEPPEELYTMWDACRDKVIITYSFSLLVTLLFIALNLDKSPITLTHLIKLFKDGLLSVPFQIDKIVPKEMKPEKLSYKIQHGMANFKGRRIRIIAMTLFKRLDLGNPIVPDLRLIADNYLKELCLPNDLKPLVISLMHFKPCQFLDVNSKDYLVYKVPSYEFHIMTYILWALKLCLGLDCHYEVKLSNAVEAINDLNELPKSYFVNGKSEPTNRLFSFREWVTFYEFRQILLRHYCFRYANKCSWDTDDYIALDHHMDLLENVFDKNLKDEMAYDIINRINGGTEETDIIPRSEFKPTLLPFHTYTQVIAEHMRDPNVKMKLTEDFSQYSFKYAIEDLHLVNPCSNKKRNLVKGIRTNNKIVTNRYATCIPKYTHSPKMVFVRDCENHNWLTTNPPSLNHVVKVDKLFDRQKSNTENKDSSNSEMKDIPIENDLDSKTHSISETIQNDLDSKTHSISETIQNDLDSKTHSISETIQNDLDSKTHSLCESIQNDLNSKTHSISEISLANTSFSDRIVFEDDEDILESKITASEIDKLRKISDSIASNSKFPDIVSDCSLTNSTLSNSIQQINETKLFESGKLDETEINKLKEMNEKMANPYEIKEETEGENIFDDDFKPEIKEEPIDDCEMDCDVLNASDSLRDIPCNNPEVDRGGDTVSEGSSIDSVNFNEKTFDRAKTIREIIQYICKKHKLPIPAEYNPKTLLKKEMGFFSKKLDCLAYRICKGPKRNNTIEKEMRGVWQGYVAEYHTAMQEDLINQITQKVNLAVQNAEAQANEDLMDEPMETDAMNNDAVSNHSDANITISEDNAGTRSKRDSESEEDKLFSDESDGETHAKELMPEKNPEFDEEKYDASQLYIKAAKTSNEGEMELDPELSSIINKKIAKDSKDPTLLTWTEERKKLKRPDSEDEIPLSVLQEFTELRKKLRKQNDIKLEPFLKKKVENFPYWFRFYDYAKYRVLGTTFEKQVCDELPKSFSFVLRECALMLGVAEGNLYRNLQRFEVTAAEKSGFIINSKGQNKGQICKNLNQSKEY